MSIILASRTNVYSGSPLARVGEKREDEAWIQAALKHPDSLFVPVWRARSLIRGGEEGSKPEAVFITGEAAKELHMAGGPWSFLGLREGRAVFAIDVSHVDDPLPLLPTDVARFVDLRNVGSAVGNEDASILAHARGLMHWRVKHRFCGVCGAPCEAKTAGHMMRCTGCETQHFPRSDPAVIMLIHQGDRALLGHSTRFPNAKMYSTLAGFVEPGERVDGLADRGHQRDHAGQVGRPELGLRDQRRQRGQVADADAEQGAAEQNQGNRRSRAEQHDGAHGLHGQVGRGDEATVGARRHGQAQKGAPADGAGRGRTHRGAGAGNAEDRRHQREQVRQQADLREQPEHRRPGERYEPLVAPRAGEAGNRGRLAAGRCPSRGGGFPTRADDAPAEEGLFGLVHGTLGKHGGWFMVASALAVSGAPDIPRPMRRMLRRRPKPFAAVPASMSGTPAVKGTYRV